MWGHTVVDFLGCVSRNIVRIPVKAGAFWFTPLIPASERQKQADIREFKAILICLVSSRTARAKL